MANTFTAVFRKIWAKETQIAFVKMAVFPEITTNKFLPDLTKGRTLTRPYYTQNTIQAYTPGTDVTEQAIVTTEELLTVDQMYADLQYVDDFEALQSAYDNAQKFAQIVLRKLTAQIDADVLGAGALNAGSTLDGGDVTSGTDLDGIALTTSTILEVLGGARKALRMKDVNVDQDAFMVISPAGESIAYQAGCTRETTYGDSVYQNGYIGRLNGFRIFISNNLTGTQTLNFATDWTADDTITINGVTVTAKASPSAAGEIDVAGSADATRALLATFINAQGATSSSGEYVALSAANQLKWRGLSAVNDNTNNWLTIYSKGIPELTCSETLTAVADGFDADKKATFFLAGIVDAITLVVQSNPKMKMQDAPKRNGNFILSTVLYGVKVFADGANMLVRAMVKTA